MARIIDADSFLVTLQKTDRDVCPTQEVWGYSYPLLADLIEDAPTIERRPTRSQFKRMAVQLGYEPVIHCRECGHYDPDTEFCEIHSHFITRHGEFCYPSESSEWKMFSPDYFCGDGERRTDE